MIAYEGKFFYVQLTMQKRQFFLHSRKAMKNPIKLELPGKVFFS